MKLRCVKNALLAVTSGVLAVGFTTTVHAEPAFTGWGGCSIWDGNGDLQTSGSFHVVITNSKDGNTIVTCQAKDLPNDSGVAVHYDINNHPPAPYGGQCFITVNNEMYFTDDWKVTVSASGNASGVCKFEGVFYPIP